MTRHARVVVQRALVTAGLCSILAACAASGGPFSPKLLAKLIPSNTQAPGAAHTEVAAAAAEPQETPPLFLSDSAGTPPAAPHVVAARSEGEPTAYSAVGLASWYGTDFHGRQTANGETFDRGALTAAHPSLPLPSYVRVTNLDNNRSIILRVNDRGPYAHNRLIDVSEQASELLAFRRFGLTRVRVDYLARAPLHVDDSAMLLASYRGPPTGRAIAAAKPATTPAVAFADDGGGGDDAMNRLNQRASAVDRILMAFDATSPAAD